MNVYDSIKSRRTVRRFKQESIDREYITKMIDAARVSPSAGNMQSLKYAIIDSFDERKAIFPHVKYAGYINDWNPEFDETPPCFIAVLNDTNIRRTNSYTECDAGIAMMAISLVCVEMGLDSCILGAIDKEEITRVLEIKPEYEILYLVGVGKSDQSNAQIDNSDSVKYVMDELKNFTVPKRRIEDIIVYRNER
ncbi:MAG: nitroreductase family protein [Ruminococcaceae bacterium]|nr:nitroreductase family protein [Oscillospiraceae bacterium]